MWDRNWVRSWVYWRMVALKAGLWAALTACQLAEWKVALTAEEKGESWAENWAAQTADSTAALMAARMDWTLAG